MTTGKLAAWGLPPSLAMRASEDRPLVPVHRSAEGAKVEVVPDNLNVKELNLVIE